MLVVDLDGEPLAPLRALEEILLCLGTWEDDDRQDPRADTEPLRLPAPLADRVALAVAQRLLATLAPTQSRGSGCGRLLAPNGRYEHVPLTMLTLPAADIDLLCAMPPPSATPAGRRHRRTGRRVCRSARRRLPLGRPHRTGLAPCAAGRPARPLPTADTRLLTTRLPAIPPGADCVLSGAEEAAHARTADRMNHIWAHGRRHRPLPVLTRGRASGQPPPHHFSGDPCNRRSRRRDGAAKFSSPDGLSTNRHRTILVRTESADSPQDGHISPLTTNGLPHLYTQLRKGVSILSAGQQHALQSCPG